MLANVYFQLFQKNAFGCIISFQKSMADKDPSKFPTLPSKVKRPLNPVSEFESELAALKAVSCFLSI